MIGPMLWIAAGLLYYVYQWQTFWKVEGFAKMAEAVEERLRHSNLDLSDSACSALAKTAFLIYSILVIALGPILGICWLLKSKK